jgi:hypothetical protein
VTAHAKLSASGSAMWFACPGSIKAIDGLPDTSSVFADEGSAAHELGEICLTTGAAASEWVGRPLIEWSAWTVTAEMADYVQQYVDYVKSLGGEQAYEIRCDFSEWVPEGFGTSDAITYVADTKTLHVVDLKYGQGVKVYADNNTQGILYALGVYDAMTLSHEIERVVITIVQPRLDHIDEWEIGVDDLLSWGERLAQAAELALSDDAPRVPGDKQCQWCKAKATCPALLTLTEQTLSADFDDLDLIATDRLSDKQMAQALSHKKLILSWLDAIEAEVVGRLTSGGSFAGYKMVAGRSSRDWADDEKVIANQLVGFGANREDLYTWRFITPAAAEKLVGKKAAKDLGALMRKSEGRPTLVPESDKRPAVTVSAADFDDIDGSKTHD